MSQKTKDQQAPLATMPGVVLIPGDREAAKKLLAEWLQNDDPEDSAEQKATLEELKQALDAHRFSSRKLFPEGS